MLNRVWSTSSQLLFQIEKSNVKLWHKIMGHIGFQGLHDLSKVRSSKGMPYILVIIKTCDCSEVSLITTYITIHIVMYVILVLYEDDVLLTGNDSPNFQDD